MLIFHADGQTFAQIAYHAVYTPVQCVTVLETMAGQNQQKSALRNSTGTKHKTCLKFRMFARAKNGISNGARTSPEGLDQITIIPALEFYVCSEARTCCLVGWVFRPRKEVLSWRTKRIFCYMCIHSRHKNQIALISTRISASLSGQPTHTHFFQRIDWKADQPWLCSWVFLMLPGVAWCEILMQRATKNIHRRTHSLLFDKL